MPAVKGIESKMEEGLVVELVVEGEPGCVEDGAMLQGKDSWTKQGVEEAWEVSKHKVDMRSSEAEKGYSVGGTAGQERETLGYLGGWIRYWQSADRRRGEAR